MGAARETVGDAVDDWRQTVSSLTRWVLAHKRIVVTFWAVLTVAGVIAAGPAGEALDQEFSAPDKEGWTTNERISSSTPGPGTSTPSSRS